MWINKQTGKKYCVKCVILYRKYLLQRTETHTDSFIPLASYFLPIQLLEIFTLVKEEES